MQIECSFCGGVLNTQSKDLYVEQTGWAKPRAQGGVNAIKLRKPTGRFAHGGCVSLALLGVNQTQGEIW